jgi:hypothetical protein
MCDFGARAVPFLHLRGWAEKNPPNFFGAHLAARDIQAPSRALAAEAFRISTKKRPS